MQLNQLDSELNIKQMLNPEFELTTSSGELTNLTRNDSTKFKVNNLAGVQEKHFTQIYTNTTI